MNLFGGLIDLPVFEILFLLLIFLLAGLGAMMWGILYALKDIRTLKNLMREEEADLREFDADIARLEKLEGQKDREKLKSYVDSCIRKGYSWESIKRSLSQRGWDKSVLEQLRR